MKTILFLFAVLIFGLVSCATRNVSRQQVEEGVVINGVRWATRNVETPGRFARNFVSSGGFFTFEEAQNACPYGWRLPTREELVSLRNAGGEWRIVNGVNGHIFGTAPNRLFLRAPGERTRTGAIDRAGTDGTYWSSTAIDAYTGWTLRFSSGGNGVSSGNRFFGFSVRCVAE